MNHGFSARDVCLLRHVRGVQFHRIEHILQSGADAVALDRWTALDWSQHCPRVNPAVLKKEWKRVRSQTPLNLRIDRTFEQSDGVISLADTDYPESLRKLRNPPVCLFGKGDLNLIHEPQTAIVGSRRTTAYGRRVAAEISTAVATHDRIVTSGLAKGIDRIAHESALSAGALTVAVIGCGLDVTYPRCNRDLYEAIPRSGGVIFTEYLHGSRPDAAHFPERNRIIAALANPVIVIEAGIKSGAILTADAALDLGADVFAVPGPIDSEQSRGCNLLIRDGAYILSDIDDLGFHSGRTATANPVEAVLRIELDNHGQLLMNSLNSPKTLDTLVIETGLPMAELLAILLDLELNGLIRQRGFQEYERA